MEKTTALRNSLLMKILMSGCLAARREPWRSSRTLMMAAMNGGTEKNAVTMLKGKIQRLTRIRSVFWRFFGTNPEIRTTVFTKAATPQFPVDAKSNSQRLSFSAGCLATVFDDNGKYFGVLQVWLWRAEIRFGATLSSEHSARIWSTLFQPQISSLLYGKLRWL